MSSDRDDALHLFFSYSHRDEALRDELAKHLKRLEREGAIHPWHDRRIDAGGDWQGEISEHLETADIVLLLISSDFIASDYCFDLEMTRALERHDAGEARVIPVILRPSDWRTERLARLQALPTGAKPVTEWPDRDAAFLDVTHSIRRVVEELQGGTALRPEPHYPSASIRELSEALEVAYRRKAELEAAGQDTAPVIDEILRMKRRLREGAQLQPGDFLADGRYQLIEPIGQGGFARVWKAYDDRRHSVVAAKVLHTQYAADRTRRERFFRGARQMARLQHSGIVRVIEEPYEDGGYFFFVMEYIGGGNLHQVVKSGSLSIKERQRIILKVGEALTYAHENGVIHRDVKPSNILLDVANRPKLTDFDLVWAADTTGGTRTTGLGTYLYAAPEAMVDAKMAGVQADVYGLGMTAVFAFHGSDLPHDVLRNLPKFIDDLRVSELSGAVLRRAVASGVDSRWPTVEEFCKALQNPPAGLQKSTTLTESERSEIIRLLREEGLNKSGQGTISARGVGPALVNYVISGSAGSVEAIGRDTAVGLGITQDSLIEDTKDQVLRHPLARIFKDKLEAELTLSDGARVRVRIVGHNMKVGLPSRFSIGVRSSYEIDLLEHPRSPGEPHRR